MPPTTLIRNAAWAVVWDAATQRHAYARHVDLLLAAGRIAALAPHDPAAPPPAADEVIDATGLLVIPGLVNVHTHPTTEPALRGVREDHGVPEQQMTGLFERAQSLRLDEAGRQAAQRLAYAELLVGGVTSVVDLSEPYAGWLDVMRESGLRVWAGPGFASARWGMTAPQTVTWTWTEGAGRAGFQRAQALLAEAEADPSGRLSGIVFPAQIDTVEEALFRDAIAFAEDSGRPFTTHIAQAVVEVREMIARHGKTPIQWAAEIGLLDLVKIAHEVQSVVFFGSVAISFTGLESAMIRGSKFELMRVFQNVFKNALEAGSTQMSVSLARAGERIEMTVTDNGAGMDPERMRKALKGGFTSKENGTGLGLSICRHLLGTHGATMVLESAAGKGSVVRMVFPAAS